MCPGLFQTSTCGMVLSESLYKGLIPGLIHLNSINSDERGVVTACYGCTG